MNSREIFGSVGLATGNNRLYVGDGNLPLWEIITRTLHWLPYTTYIFVNHQSQHVYM